VTAATTALARPGPRQQRARSHPATILPPAPTLRQASPAGLLGELAALLRSHGLDHLYATATATEGVLSVACGVTVWTNGQTLRGHTPARTFVLPASTHAAARCLADLTSRHPARPAARAWPTTASSAPPTHAPPLPEEPPAPASPFHPASPGPHHLQ
jgi:hypothetical protein